jgi:hypothetical protein
VSDSSLSCSWECLEVSIDDRMISVMNLCHTVLRESAISNVLQSLTQSESVVQQELTAIGNVLQCLIHFESPVLHYRTQHQVLLCVVQSEDIVDT